MLVDTHTGCLQTTNKPNVYAHCTFTYLHTDLKRTDNKGKQTDTNETHLLQAYTKYTVPTTLYRTYNNTHTLVMLVSICIFHLDYNGDYTLPSRGPPPIRHPPGAYHNSASSSSQLYLSFFRTLLYCKSLFYVCLQLRSVTTSYSHHVSNVASSSHSAIQR